ncbi:acetyl-CoA-benzylalcohol acetyltransferase [Capsicum chacoense]
MGSLCVDFNDQIQVEIMSKKLIKPSSPTPNNLQNYKLSFFDQLAEHTHTPFVLFYPKKNTSTTTDFMVQQLEESLARTLTHVYPAAARFHDNKCSIICQDQGVPLIKAKVNRRMDEEFLKQAHNNLDLVLHFWPLINNDVNANNLFAMPIMFVQITIFQCGGIALSVSIAHPAIDGWTNFTFIYEWSKVCKLGIPSEKINFMSFDLVNIFGPRDITFSDQAKPLDTKLVAKKFVMDEKVLSKLRDKLTSSNNNSEALCFKPSRVEMVTAILWRAQLRASRAITGEMKPSVMSFPLNLRGKLKYREAINPFGNFIIDIPITYEPKGTNVLELQHFITLIREEVEKIVDYCGEASLDEVVEMVGNLYNKCYEGREWGANDDVEEFTCSSLTRFHMQEADFGWGNPNLMHFGSRNNQVFWLYSTQCGNSIGVQMDLKEKYMDFIRHDQEFLAFTKSV